MKPNFKNIDIYAGFQPQNGMEWQKANGITADWKTPEHELRIHQASYTCQAIKESAEYVPNKAVNHFSICFPF